MAQAMIKKSGVVTARSSIYRYLYHNNEFCSRQTLANSCQISMPTLYQNLNELIEEGLVRYSGEEQSTGGRRAQGLEIVPDARIAIGIAVSENQLRLIAVDLKLNELAYRVVPFDFMARLSSQEYGLEKILEEFLDDSGTDRGKILGVGVTIPGLITPDRTKILFAPTLHIRDVPLDFMTRNIPYPVFVDNDASASGYVEGYVREEKKHLAYISLEFGVGGAVMMDGIPYTGDHYHSGEFGHICVEPGGLPCNCGKNGCLEAYCIPRRIEETFGITAEEFFKGVSEHNVPYENLMYDMLRHLAVAVNTINMTLDCEVVLGGLFSEYLRPYLPVIRQYVMAGNPFAENADFVTMSTVPRHITPIGAALHYVRDYVDSV
ncbi:MAG: ROK family transcriptional regulator [Lachnospiraceae bacterium]|nr:ROK family transcriptional regulator [Lachnospiraceae bacterium]